MTTVFVSRGGGCLWLPPSLQPLCWVGPIAPIFQSLVSWVRPRTTGKAGSSQGIKVHIWQWLPPIAEVAVLRVGQVCAGATHHRWEEELHHFPEPLVSVGRMATLSLSCQKAVAFTAGKAQDRAEALGEPGCGGHVPLRGLVVLYELLNKLSPGVDCEDARFREAHLPVGKNILQETERVRMVSETVEGSQSGGAADVRKGYSHWVCSQRQHRKAVFGAETAAGCHSGRQP